MFRIEKLRQSNPVEITGNEINFGNDLKEYKANALTYGKNLRGKYINKDTGQTISLGKNSLKEVLQHDYKNKYQLQSIAAIPQIIQESFYIDSETNVDSKINADKFDYYVVGLKIDGEEYTVRSVIVTLKDGTRYYDHKLTQIEKGKLIDSLVGKTNPGFNQTESLNSDIKDKRLVSILQTNSSKVVDENGEPLVVYHRTYVDFYEFDNTKSQYKQGGVGSNYYFSDDRYGYSNYGKREIAAYINISTPTDKVNVNGEFIPKENDGAIFSRDRFGEKEVVVIATSPNQICYRKHRIF
ncbi:MAG TPA: hypothetical protein VFC94_05660 [Bacteroidaceae bacterium]|nr:hypothetical protein [Bacteroidaceae bacterium]